MKNVLIAMIALVSIYAQADCQYKGKSYETYSTISKIDNAYYEQPVVSWNGQYASKDGWVMIFICSPVVAVEDFDGKDWGVDRIKASHDAWILSPKHFSYQEIEITYPDEVVVIRSDS
jgi:hypothetical protein